MDNNVTIREISRADKPRLLEMMVEFYNSPALLHHTPKTVLSRVIDDCVGACPFVTGYAAVDENDILGYTMLAISYSTEYGGTSVIVEDLYVKPQARRLGIGEKLLRFVCDKYKASAARIRLEVAPDNSDAIRLYERCGFTAIDYKQMGIVFD